MRFCVYVEVKQQDTGNKNKRVINIESPPGKTKCERRKEESEKSEDVRMRNERTKDLPGGPKVKHNNTFLPSELGTGKVFTFGGDNERVDAGSEDGTLPTLTEAKSGAFLVLSSNGVVGFNLEFGEEFKGVCKADFLCSGLEEVDSAVKGFVFPSILVLVDKRLLEDCVVGVD